jgi:hypothetical protein
MKQIQNNQIHKKAYGILKSQKNPWTKSFEAFAKSLWLPIKNP